jgi:hypothetical protein
MSYMGWREWLMLFFCMCLVLPWLIGGLLVIKDLRERYKRKHRE